MGKKIIINESQFNSIVENIASEASINAKKRNAKNVENVFRKGAAGYNNIKTLAVFTANNPDSQAMSGTFNKKANHKLLQALKEANYIVVPAQGKFGNVENSYAVINISLEATKLYCGKYQQTSFVYTELEDGNVMSYYYEKQDTSLPYNKNTNPYVLADTAEGYTDMSDAEDFFTIIGNKFKYQIPFPTMCECSERITSNFLKEDNQKLIRGKSLQECLDFAINKTGMAPGIMRNILYKN
jgi:hypothetical protein